MQSVLISCGRWLHAFQVISQKRLVFCIQSFTYTYKSTHRYLEDRSELPVYWPSCIGSMVWIMSCRSPCLNFAPVWWWELCDNGACGVSEAVLDVTLPPGCVPTLVSLDVATVPCWKQKKSHWNYLRFTASASVNRQIVYNFLSVMDNSGIIMSAAVIEIV